MPQANAPGIVFYTTLKNSGKPWEVFKSVVPSLRRSFVGVDNRKESRSHTRLPKELAATASWLEIELVEVPVSTADEAAEKVARLSKKSNDFGVFGFCSGLFKDLTRIASVAAKRRLPLFGCNAFQVAEQNVLLSYTPDLYSLGYRRAWLLNRIRKGASPQTLPVEVPQKFAPAINRSVAKEIGSDFPREALLLTDRIYR